MKVAALGRLDENWKGWLVPAAALAFAGAAGARSLKHLFNMLGDKSNGSQADTTIKSLRPPVAGVPVEVSPEEAEELRRRGVQVKAASDSSFLGPMIVGGAGVAAGLLGWTAADKLIDRSRKKAVKGDIRKMRARIEALLQDSPEAEDAAAHGMMKAAEDIHFSKTASNSFGTADRLLSVLGIGGIVPLVLGGGLTLKAISSYRAARSASPNEAKIKALRDSLTSRNAPTRAELVPVERRRAQAEKQEDEDVEELVTGNTSPANQAAVNALY